MRIKQKTRCIDEVLLFIFLSHLHFGQSKKDKKYYLKIDKAILDNFKEAAPGCAVLIAKEGKIILEKVMELQTLS
ncbi:MAG: hypothetical protein JNL53_16210 [Cyclobacteriaceae bacterium]|nr:hypothetical protein [Cyclobacteriaceae bacterium]